MTGSGVGRTSSCGGREGLLVSAQPLTDLAVLSLVSVDPTRHMVMADFVDVSLRQPSVG